MRILKLVTVFVYAISIPTVAMSNDDVKEECEGTIFAPLGKPTEFLESSDPGRNLAVRRWVPEEAEIKSALVVHHGGIGWHSGYFDILGKALAEHGIAVVAYDMVGSGYSDSWKGMRQTGESMDQVARDLSHVIADCRAKYPGKRVFALGESFGGMILLHSILKARIDDQVDPPADGYILSGPVIKVRKEMLPPKPVIAILVFLSRFFPHLKMPGADFASTFHEAFGDERWATASWADPFIQEAVATNPRLGFVATVLKASARISDNMDKVDVPFLVVIGGDDIRVYPEDSEELAKRSVSTDKTLHVIPGGRHQLYQDKEEITKDAIEKVKSWILARS